MRKQPPLDPIAEYQRGKMGERRFGDGARCACGESRPRALVPGSGPVICFGCQRKKRGQRGFDEHHFAGKSNSPVTVRVPVNDHRAELSPAQYDWPKDTLQNPDGCPLLSAAAHIRGFADTILHLTDQLLWIAELLESLHRCLSKHQHLKRQLRTELARFRIRR